MASFKSLFAIVVLAACYVSQLDAAPASKTSLPVCLEHPEKAASDRGFSIGHFSRDTTAAKDRFVADGDPNVIVQVEKSQVTGKYITTIQSGDLNATNRYVRVYFAVPNPANPIENRHFELTQANSKCRVENSAQYDGIKGADYV